MVEHKSIFNAIREESIVRTALNKGIGATAYEFNFPKSEVNEIVSRAIQDHQDVMKLRQDSVAELRNLLDGNDDDSCYKCGKVGHIARNCSNDAEDWCCICFNRGHMARDCSGDGCCKCNSVGHLGRDCNEDWMFGRGGRLCYYCGMLGYMAVCSLCGKRGHLGKDCW